MPAAVSASATISPAKGSVLPSSDPRESKVTLLPSAAIHVAASQATTPPPTTINEPGISLTPVASRDVHGCASAKSSGITAVLPVATITAMRARTV